MTTIAETPTTPTTRWTALSRTTSLGRAEWLQFRRNRTLLFMAFVMPVVFPVGIYAIMRGTGGEDVAAASAAEIFLLFALTLVQFYSVLSMATTRRDEKVLKRLRTGEARDGEILTAICLPGSLVTLILSVVFVAVLTLAGAPFPANPLPMFAAVLLGLVISSALALITSGFTQNAEAAQITSLPVIMLAMGSQAAIRDLLPDGIARTLDLTPFAVASDLMQVGWIGATTAGDPDNGTWRLFLVLVLWAMAAVWAAGRTMRWDSHR